MHKYFLSAFLFLILAIPALAANTSGYAWSESVGWFDFSNVTISDTTVTGYAYNDNTGWLSFEDGTNVTNANGTLSGYAWSESVGWFDFSGVTVSGGVLSGYAYNDNTGWISFEDDTTVTTTWAPAVDTPAPEPSRRSSGSSVSSRIKNLIEMGNIEKAQELQTQYPNAPTTLPTTIEGLQALLTSLQAQLAQLLSGTPALSNNPFTRDLELNAEGSEVTQLQQQLISKGYVILAGATGFFGSQTQQALIKFQQDNNISPATGYYGPKTRAIINSLSN